MSIRNHISLSVPDVSAATKWFTQVIGPSVISEGVFSLEPNVALELIECDPSDQEPPSILDLGTLHLCFRVADITRVAERINSLPETTVLGDIALTPDGPIQGNKWVYFRSPWGTLFELQEWPDPPRYFSNTEARLYHGHPTQRPGALPGIRGLDHAGYSVANLESTITALKTFSRAAVALTTEISVDAPFTRRQFGIEVTCRSRMAMVAVSGLNIELFEHGVTDKNPPRRMTEIGGHRLVLNNVAWSPDLSANSENGGFLH